MKEVGIRLAEAVLLFAALSFCLPYIPSHEMAELPLFPGAAFAVGLFAASRVLRWQSRWWWAAGEILLFSIFVFVLNAAINIIHAG